MAKFYFINGTFKEDRPQGLAFKEILDAHHAYWMPYMQAGKVLFAGPKPTGAGLLVLKCEDGEDVQPYMDNDPMVLGGVATFEAAEFKVFFKAPAVEEWFR